MKVPYLTFEHVTKRFGALDVVDPPFSLEIRRQEFVVFLGPSGCGKTTLMRMVGGLETLSGGDIRLDGFPVGAPDQRRGMVSQSYSTFPWLTVSENVAYGMRYRKDMSKAEKRARSDHYVNLVGLTDFADSFPNRVSGGMRQRIAIARALAAGSEILLMDEPFGALDAQRREQLQVELRRIQRDDAKTVVFVTHDVEEAVFLADRIVVFSKRPARVLSIVDVASVLGAVRDLAVRDSEAFFRLRTEVLHMVRASAGVEA
ncbi:ABC transporter ATP-binding protein [Caballeronia mineralivorans]|jgi:NitT/TauT family transport system ATP-binding protein|uniref:ABC transporter ATP-binding protein n=1 Tax=Caballeronia mineralivorans TaxID=2010198 RepID=UPI002AFFDE1B|nr:ABC transporter ATP-binding protein [Caballeronia mineralivorans]MEA3103083.1 NitT/TauT family transport system ATP-binding protein [Caballeronia mineralivorans]